jgi:hypothetical protein
MTATATRHYWLIETLSRDGDWEPQVRIPDQQAALAQVDKLAESLRGAGYSVVPTGLGVWRWLGGGVRVVEGEIEE